MTPIFFENIESTDNFIYICYDYIRKILRIETYDRRMCIRSVHFLGTLDDWKLLREKVNQLQSFSMPKNGFSTYITGLLPILEQFIVTYQGKVDNQFWDTIFDLEHVNDKSR